MVDDGAFEFGVAFDAADAEEVVAVARVQAIAADDVSGFLEGEENGLVHLRSGDDGSANMRGDGAREGRDSRLVAGGPSVRGARAVFCLDDFQDYSKSMSAQRMGWPAFTELRSFFAGDDGPVFGRDAEWGPCETDGFLVENRAGSEVARGGGGLAHAEVARLGDDGEAGTEGVPAIEKAAVEVGKFGEVEGGDDVLLDAGVVVDDAFLDEVHADADGREEDSVAAIVAGETGGGVEDFLPCLDDAEVLFFGGRGIGPGVVIDDDVGAFLTSGADGGGDFVDVDKAGVEDEREAGLGGLPDEGEIGDVVAGDLYARAAFFHEEVEAFVVIDRGGEGDAYVAALGEELGVVGERDGLALDEGAVALGFFAGAVGEGDVEAAVAQADVGVVENLGLEDGNAGGGDGGEVFLREGDVLVEERADLGHEDDRVAVADGDAAKVHSFHDWRSWTARTSASGRHW